MRAKRLKLYNDAFYIKDRSFKNPNKVIAAQRRKRDETGKFNFEEKKLELSANLSD